MMGSPEGFRGVMVNKGVSIAMCVRYRARAGVVIHRRPVNDDDIFRCRTHTLLDRAAPAW